MSTARHRPEVVLISTMSLDGRITLGPHQRLLQPEVSSRWKSIEVAGAFPHRGAELDERVVLQGSGSFVDADATAPAWQALSRATAELWEDYLPRKSTNWFVVADSRVELTGPTRGMPTPHSTYWFVAPHRPDTSTTCESSGSATSLSATGRWTSQPRSSVSAWRSRRRGLWLILAERSTRPCCVRISWTTWT